MENHHSSAVLGGGTDRVRRVPGTLGDGRPSSPRVCPPPPPLPVPEAADTTLTACLPTPALLLPLQSPPTPLGSQHSGVQAFPSQPRAWTTGAPQDLYPDTISQLQLIQSSTFGESTREHKELGPSSCPSHLR